MSTTNHSTRTISLRVSDELLERIDRAAARQGETRNTYIVSWLPEYYDGHDSDRACNTT